MAVGVGRRLGLVPASVAPLVSSRRILPVKIRVCVGARMLQVNAARYLEPSESCSVYLTKGIYDASRSCLVADIGVHI